MPADGGHPGGAGTGAAAAPATGPGWLGAGPWGGLRARRIMGGRRWRNLLPRPPSCAVSAAPGLGASAELPGCLSGSPGAAAGGVACWRFGPRDPTATPACKGARLRVTTPLRFLVICLNMASQNAGATNCRRGSTQKGPSRKKKRQPLIFFTEEERRSLFRLEPEKPICTTANHGRGGRPEAGHTLEPFRGKSSDNLEMSCIGRGREGVGRVR